MGEGGGRRKEEGGRRKEEGGSREGDERIDRKDKGRVGRENEQGKGGEG